MINAMTADSGVPFSDGPAFWTDSLVVAQIAAIIFFVINCCTSPVAVQRGKRKYQEQMAKKGQLQGNTTVQL